MQPQTLDVSTDEMLLMALLLGQFIDAQIGLLRETSLECGNTTEQVRARVEIATRLRGKLPLRIDYGPADDDE